MSEPAARPTARVAAELSRVIRGRRSSAGELTPAVPVALITELCELAQWAPNHRRTWPWRFAVFTGDQAEATGTEIAAVMAEQGNAGKAKRLAERWASLPAIVVVGSAPGTSETMTVENRDAVAAGVQNLLLGATSAGLASWWRSAPKGCETMIAEAAGFEAGTAVVAIVELSWATAGEAPDGESEPASRPPPSFTRAP